MNEEHRNKAIIIIIGILLFLCIVALIIASFQYLDSGDKACKDIGYTKLFGNSLRGYTCVSDEKSIKVELECGLLNKCRVYPIQ